MKSPRFWSTILIAVVVLALIVPGCGRSTPPPESVSVEPTSTPPPTSTPAGLGAETPAPTSAQPSALTPTPMPTRRPLESPDDVEVDAAYGTIEARFTGTTDQFIVLIGENHASFTVQQNVARIAEQLLSEYDIRLLLVEGYDQAIDTGFFDAIPDPAVRREVAWAFLETHEISGIEYAALVGGPDVETIGVDDPALWQQSKEAVDSAPDLDDPVVQQAWDGLIDQIVALIDQLEYTTELDEAVAAFLDEETSFDEFYGYLLETAAAESVSTAELEAAYQEFQATLNPVMALAAERDPSIVDNSLAAMSQHEVDVAILLVGHAHFLGATEEGGLSALLQAQGVSYIYVLPCGTEDETTDEENQYYEDQLDEVPSAFEAWLNNLFKPKPTLTRPSRRAELEVVGKVAFLEALTRAGTRWDEISAAHADWLASGTIHVQNGYDVGGEFNVYPCRAQGARGNETFAIAVAASGSEPRVSHEEDVIARWQVGDRWVTAIEGRSAEVLIRRGMVASYSEPGRTFACAYEIDGGDGIAWQVGDAEIVIPDVSWETLNDLLDPERPVAEREEKIKAALGGYPPSPPLGGDGGPIIVFPEDPDYVPDAEGGEAYDEGCYFHPSYEEDWSVDWPALAILLGQWLQRPVYNDGNPVLAKRNLDQQEPARVENIGVVVDEASLDDEQREYARQIPDKIQDAGVDPDAVEISFSLDNFPSTSNVLLITAENDEDLVDRLARFGEADLLKDKYIVLFTCGEEGLRDFANWVVREYGLTGLHVYRDKIHANTLPLIVGEVYQLAQEQPGLAPAELVDQAVERAIENALRDDTIKEELKQNMNRLRNGWNQLSRPPDWDDGGAVVAQARLDPGLPG